MTKVSKEQAEKWSPTVGYSDIADMALNHWLSDFPEILSSPRELAHVMPFLAVTFGAARHAAIGVIDPVFVEIGTQVGLSTRVLITVASLTGGRVVSMDPDPNCAGSNGRLKDWTEKRGESSRWEHHVARSQDVEPLQGASFLLVDGDHGYPAVCSDMARHGSAVRDGGIIVLDDYHRQFPGKQRWLQERWTELRPFTTGPTAILTKCLGDDVVYRQDRSEVKTWSWNL